MVHAHSRVHLAKLRMKRVAKPLLLSSLINVSSGSHASGVRDQAMFESWATTRKEAIGAYQGYLNGKGVGSVVPMDQLLRTASDWNQPACLRVGAQPFEVPPQAYWRSMEKTLKLVSHLRQQGLLPEFEVVSAYRNPTVNECAASKGSRHPKNAALDLIPLGVSPGATIARLCGFYRSFGKQWAMGLSLYESGRIHIDADGYRTWGKSGHSDTSACLLKKSSNQMKKGQ